MSFPIRNVSSDLMYLQPLWFYYKSKKITQKLKKPHYLINGEFDQKDIQNKNDIKFDLLSEMFYQISCIINLYGRYYLPPFYKDMAIKKKAQTLQTGITWNIDLYILKYQKMQ